MEGLKEDEAGIFTVDDDALAAERLRRMLKGRQEGQSQRVPIFTRGRVVMAKSEDIHWIEVHGRLVEIHLERETIAVNTTLAQFQRGLDPRVFVRIHRAVVVNIRHVKEVWPLSHGDYRITLESGTELFVSRRYWRQLSELLYEGQRPFRSRPNQGHNK